MGQLTIGSGGAISTATAGDARAGDISITANTVVVDTMSTGLTTGIFASANTSGRAGGSGNITITAATVSVRQRVVYFQQHR